MSAFPIPAIKKRGPILNGLTSLPASLKMMTVDDAGNMGVQDIPVAPTLAWGNITGTLSAQTDLQSALNAKANSSALANYLPLVGGTLTGGLSGTTATFSGTGTFNAVNLTGDKLSIQQVASPFIVAIRASTGWSAEPILTGYPWHFAWADDVPKITMQTANSTTGVRVSSDSFFAFTNTTNSRTGTVDLAAYRDAADTWGFRNGANAQRLNLYGTYTDASNYRRLYISSTTAGAFTLGVEGLGTGASGNTLTIANTLGVSGNVTASSFISSSLTMTGGSPSLVSSANRLTFGSSAAYIFYRSSNSFTLDPIGSGAAQFGGNILAVAGTFSGALNVGGNITPSSGSAGSGRLEMVNQQYTASNVAINMPWGTGTPCGIYGSNGIVGFSAASTAYFEVNTSGLRVVGNRSIGLGGTIASPEVTLFSGSNVLEQRNGTNAQTLRLYNAFTDASNYDRGFVRWNSNIFQIGTERTGSYTTIRALNFLVGGSFAGGVQVSEYAGIGIRTSPAGNRAAFVGNSNGGLAYYSSAIGWEAGATANFGNALGAFTRSDIDGRSVMCPGQGPVHADQQRTGLQTLSALTTDATTLPLAIPNMVGPGTHDAVPIATNHSCTIRGCIVAVRDTNTETASFVVDACIQNAGGTVTLVSNSVTQTSNNGNVWTVTVNANNVTKRWEILCTGEAGKNVRWSGVFLVAQVAY